MAISTSLSGRARRRHARTHSVTHVRRGSIGHAGAPALRLANFLSFSLAVPAQPCARTGGASQNLPRRADPPGRIHQWIGGERPGGGSRRRPAQQDVPANEQARRPRRAPGESDAPAAKQPRFRGGGRQGLRALDHATSYGARGIATSLSPGQIGLQILRRHGRGGPLAHKMQLAGRTRTICTRGPPRSLFMEPRATGPAYHWAWGPLVTCTVS